MPLSHQNLFTHPVQPRNVGLMVVGDNLSTMSRHMPLNTNPFIYGITISDHCQTLKNLTKVDFYSFNFMSQQDLSDTDYCGRVSGKDQNKQQKIDLKLENFEHKTNYIASSLGVLILKKRELIPFGDHHLVVGEVIEMLGNGQAVSELDPILFWGRGWYSQIGETQRYRSEKLPPKKINSLLRKH